jgi:succinoglycan biosynthesis transport protein ExoP
MTARSNITASAGTQGGTGHEVTSDGLPQTLWRHKEIVVGSLTLALLIGVVAVVRTVPTWESFSKLLFQQERSKLAGTDSLVISDTYLHAQCELMSSTPILDDAAKTLKPMHLRSLAGTTDITSMLQHGLDLSVGKDDGILTVSYSSPFASDSAAIVNTVVQTYVVYESQHRKNTALDTLSLLQREKDTRDREMTEGRTEMAEFRKLHPDVSFDTDKGNIINEKLAKLSDELTDAQSQTMDLQAENDSMKAQLAAHPVEGATSAGATADPAWVRGELGRARLNLETLASRFPENNPNILQARADVSRLNEMLAQSEHTELAAKMSQTAADLDVAQRRESELKKAFAQQETVAATLNTEMADYGRREEQVNRAEREIADLDRQIELIDRTQDVPLDVRILEEAKPASSPHGTKSQTLGMAAVLGLLVGVGVSLGIDVLDQRLRSPEEVRGVLGLPVLGVIPHQQGKLSMAACGLIAHYDPMSEVAEAARSVRTAVYFASRSTPAKVVLVASPTQGDGKSTFVSNLAIAMAQAGSRTLLVDTDFREPALRTIFDIQTAAGLSEVLSGRTTLDRAISRTPVEGLEVLPSGPIPRNPSEMLNSPAFAALIESLAERYQCILLDSPPVLSVTDARILGATADITLFVVRTGATSRKAADQGLDMLLSVGSRVLGAVVNDVTRRRASQRVRGASRFLETIAEEQARAVRAGRAHGANGTGDGQLAALGMEKH